MLGRRVQVQIPDQLVTLGGDRTCPRPRSLQLQDAGRESTCLLQAPEFALGKPSLDVAPSKHGRTVTYDAISLQHGCTWYHRGRGWVCIKATDAWQRASWRLQRCGATAELRACGLGLRVTGPTGDVPR